MLWAIFCWETRGPAIHMDVNLTGVTYLNIVTDHVHPFITMLFPGGTGLFQKNNAHCHMVNIVQEWFKKHDEEFKVLPWPPNSQDLNTI